MAYIAWSWLGPSAPRHYYMSRAWLRPPIGSASLGQPEHQAQSLDSRASRRPIVQTHSCDRRAWKKPPVGHAEPQSHPQPRVQVPGSTSRSTVTVASTLVQATGPRTWMKPPAFDAQPCGSTGAEKRQAPCDDRLLAVMSTRTKKRGCGGCGG